MLKVVGGKQSLLSQASASRAQVQLMPQAMGQTQVLADRGHAKSRPTLYTSAGVSSFSEISRGQRLGLVGWGSEKAQARKQF